MAWKTITICGWMVSFEPDSDWWMRYKDVPGFSSIDRIDIDGVETSYKETDFASTNIGNITTKFPAKAFGLRRRKCKCRFTFKVNTSSFDPHKLQLHYANVVITIGDEVIDTGNRIIDKITYNGKNCNLKWESSEEQEFKSVIWHKSPFIYDHIWFHEGLAAVELNDWCGYIDNRGNVAIPFQFQSANEFHDGLASVYIDGCGWGFIDKTGREVIPCEYDEVHDFKEGFAYFEEDKDDRTYGFIDKSGKQVIPCIHKCFSDGWGAEHHDFSCGVAVVCNEQYRFGYIDKKGKAITPIVYSYAKPFSEGLGAVRKNGKWGFIDTTGATIIPLIYSAVRSFSEGLAAVKMDDKWGYIDKSNNLVIPCKFDEAYNFDNGLAIAEINGNVGFIDKSGRYVIDCKYDDAWDFRNGLAPVKKNKKWGYIDLEGTIVIPFVYDKAEYFHKNGLACVEVNDKMGCIDRQGRIVVPLVYDCIGNHEAVLTAELYGRYGLLDLKGNPIDDNTIYKRLSKKYDQVFINNGEIKTYSIALDGKYGLADANGKELIPPRYDWLGEGFYDGLCVAGYRGKNGVDLVNYDGVNWGAINTQGEVIVPMKYKKLLRCDEVKKCSLYQ